MSGRTDLNRGIFLDGSSLINVCTDLGSLGNVRTGRKGELFKSARASRRNLSFYIRKVLTGHSRAVMHSARS
jgi:hypothetical protein